MKTARKVISEENDGKNEEKTGRKKRSVSQQKDVKKEPKVPRKKTSSNNVKGKAVSVTKLSTSAKKNVVVTEKNQSQLKPPPEVSRILNSNLLELKSPVNMTPYRAMATPNLKPSVEVTSILSPTLRKAMATPKLNVISPSRNDAVSTVTNDTKPCGLAAFGMRGAKSSSGVLKQTYGSNRDSHLKCVLIHGGGLIKPAIVFRYEALDLLYKNGSWSEKCMNDCIRDRLDWIEELHFDSAVLPWFHNNEVIMNPGKYAIRLFVIYTEELPAKKDAIQLGNYICMQINKTNSTKCTIDENTFFWISEPTVWSDIIGYDAAKQQMENLIGLPFEGMSNVCIHLLTLFL